MSNSTLQTAKKWPIKFIPLLLIVMFTVPMIAAWSFYISGRTFLVSQTVNSGQLIIPPQQFSQLPMKQLDGQAYASKQLLGKWLLFYIAPETCDSNCTDNLYKIRQIRTALGKNSDRVQRMLITEPSGITPALQQTIEQDYRGTLQAVTSKTDLEQFLSPLASKTVALNSGYLYLTDPLGNVMMSYAPTAKPKGILKDLKRLLKVSQIG